MYNELVYTEQFILANSQMWFMEFIRSKSDPGLSGTNKLFGTKKVLYMINGNE